MGCWSTDFVTDSRTGTDGRCANGSRFGLGGLVPAAGSGFRGACLWGNQRTLSRTHGRERMDGAQMGVASEWGACPCGGCWVSAGVSVCAESVNARALCCIIAAIKKELTMLAQTALKYDVKVNKDGQVELVVPFPAGAHVTVFVVEASDAFADLLYASQTSLDFWDNPIDDEDWNNA